LSSSTSPRLSSKSNIHCLAWRLRREKNTNSIRFFLYTPSPLDEGAIPHSQL
jgi:hypothetical protein